MLSDEIATRAERGDDAGEMLCPNFEDHTPCPEGYIHWHSWAKEMSKTHRQRKCHSCGLYAIWDPKQTAIARSMEHGD